MPSNNETKKQNKKNYKIGTRGSLLALTQCNQVRVELERLTGDHFELEVIKTQGDLITNVPLWQLDGKDFFTKELDEALLSGKVDLVVHSYKDLGSERPEGIILAAVTKRTFAHDILLINNQTIIELKNKKEFVVGTSSPRRIVNIEKNLAPYLPNGKHLKVSTKMLRGNVNTRIQKLKNGEYDAIVLAFPGIERLALTESSRLELEQLLKGMNFMILPQSDFPSSASQGALGIECFKNRNDDGELFLKLQKMQDQETKDEVSRERTAFNKYGGGCHLAVGINVKKRDDLYLHTHRGFLAEKEIHISYLEGRNLPSFEKTPTIFNGLPSDDKLVTKIPLTPDLTNRSHLYITSKHCFPALKSLEKNPLSPLSLWAAGTKTMKDLAGLGFWVNATADSFGEEEIKKFRDSKALKLMIDTEAPLSVLSNDEGSTHLGFILPSYKRVIETNLSQEFIEKINATEVFYWTSFFQYKAYIKQFPKIIERIHVCGIGKTYQQFKENNITVLAMSSMAEFKNWINV